jgi:hypothetical protein
MCSPSPTLENVGVYTVTVAYSGDSNYPSVTNTPTLTITRDPVTITAGNASRPYNTANPASVPDTITPQDPFPTGQSITDDPTTYTTSAVLSSPPGSYPIVPGPAVAGSGTLLTNYAITYINGTLTITGGVSNISPAVSAVYSTAYTLTSTFTSPTNGGPVPTGTATFSILGQPICATATLMGGVATCTPSPTLENVGAYTVTVAYSGDNTYPPSTPTISLTITQAPVTITVGNATRPYDTPNPTFTGTITSQYPFPSGQSINATYTTAAIQTSPPGNYPITATASAGPNTLLTNYNVTVVPGTLTITQETGGVTITSPPVTAVYGTAYTLTASLTSQGAAPTGTVSFTVGSQTLCASAVLPASGVITCSPSPTLLNAGNYPVTVNYSGNADYAASTSSIALTIDPAPVTITANNATRPYNTPNPTFTGTVKGVVSGQSITATFTTTATQTSAPGTYPITPTAPVAGTGTLLSNYTVTLVNGILTITSVATGPTSPVGSFTISVTPPEQEIDLNGTVNFPVKLTSVDEFTDTVSFSCSGLPAGASCAFAPGTLKPTAGGTSTTVLTIGATVNTDNVPPGSFGYLRGMPANPGHAPSSFVLAWTMLPFGFGGSAATLLIGRRRKRTGKKTRWALWMVPMFLLLAGLSGCATPNNFKIYTVTITATDSTYAVPVTQTTTVQLVLAR